MIGIAWSGDTGFRFLPHVTHLSATIHAAAASPIVKALNSRSKDTLRTWRRSPTPLASRSSPYSELRRVAPRRLHTLLGILIALPISFLLGATFVRTQARAQMTSNPTSKQLEEAEIHLKSARLAFEHDNPGMRQLYASIRMPDASPAHLRAYMDLMQVATTSANAVNLLRESFRIDIHDVAPKVRCPTIVFHARGDGVAPFNEGRSLAALIPGARFVPLESRNQRLIEGEPAWEHFVSEFQDLAENRLLRT